MKGYCNHLARFCPSIRLYNRLPVRVIMYVHPVPWTFSNNSSYLWYLAVVLRHWGFCIPVHSLWHICRHSVSMHTYCYWHCRIYISPLWWLSRAWNSLRLVRPDPPRPTALHTTVKKGIFFFWHWLKLVTFSQEPESLTTRLGWAIICISSMCECYCTTCLHLVMEKESIHYKLIWSIVSDIH